MLEGESYLYKEGYRLIAGTDEAGRGPLAGPLFVAAVVFPEGYKNPDLDDSKKLTAHKRELLFETIKKDALDYAIISFTPEEVDRLDPYHASREGMKKALSKLRFDIAVTDAMPLDGVDYPYINVIKADAKYLAVAAASILAKVSRDRYMNELDVKYPQYGFASNKGYGTKDHLLALERHGPIKGVHRFSYTPVKDSFQMKIDLF